MEHREAATAYQRLVTAGEPVPPEIRALRNEYQIRCRDRRHASNQPGSAPGDALEHYRQWATAAYARYKETLTAIERDCQQRRRAAYADCYQAAYTAADELLRPRNRVTGEDE